jgi:uncharacterized membrane protein
MANIHGERSHASIFGHPLHPMIVPFPIAFLVGTLVTDIVFKSTDNVFWATMSKWQILAALVMAAIAAVLGLTDFVTIKRVRRGWIGWTHMLGNVAVVLLSLFSLIYRWNDPAAGVMSVGLPISIAVVIILLITGWLGGELVFRHKIGVLEGDDVAMTQRDHRLHPAE